MRAFLKRLLVFCIPLLLLLALYIILDPFKVIWHYDSYYKDGMPQYVTLNKDYVSTSTFDNYYKTYKYDSFIWGNSRSIFFQVEEWQKHIGVLTSPFHFDASGESLYALHKKVLYVDKKVPIKNALLVVDHQLLAQSKGRTNHICITSPQLVGYRNWLLFHFVFIKSFLDPKFFCSYLTLLITGEKKSFMGNLMDDRVINYIEKYNEERFDFYENEIQNGEYYTEKRMKAFFPRCYSDSIDDVAIFEPHICMLKDIKKVFEKNKTNYKIIISPLYDQIKLNPSDIRCLKDIFGENNVFDFSGKNTITDDFHNYYEASHYRSTVASLIMEQIYGKKEE